MYHLASDEDDHGSDSGDTSKNSDESRVALSSNDDDTRTDGQIILSAVGEAQDEGPL